MCSSNFLFCFPSPMWACRGRTVGAHFKTPSSSNSRSNQREGGRVARKKKKKNTDKCQPMGARRDARCPLRVAHHWVSDEVLVVSGAGSRERGPVATQVLWSPDYKAGPAGGPIWARATGATASRRDKKTQRLPLLRGGGRGVRVGGCACLCLTALNLAETERQKLPSPHKKKRFFRESHKYRGLIFKREVVMASKWRKWLPCLASKPPRELQPPLIRFEV